MSQILSGKAVLAVIEHELKEKISKLPRQLKVGVVYVGNNPVIENFISKKVSFAAAIGVRLDVLRLPETTPTDDIVDAVRTHSKEYDGLIVQLPLPVGVDVDRVLDAVPLPKDIDMLSVSAREYMAQGHTEILPGVAGAVREFILRTPISLTGKKIVIIGQGKLVGLPVKEWLHSIHLEPIIVGRKTENLKEIIANADIIISGAGVPGLITGDMVKEGVILFDAGTSEVEGKIEGDVSKDAYPKASYYTPVPGGIGPLTVGSLFINLLVLMKLES